ncbi:unnamed protein product [Xylocopa violacea]|uniref:TIL domain-containing protein n=1 Tax=Xylocopa violacea TaxID=135666 RepID=A0ABP1P8D4_XYLVO
MTTLTLVSRVSLKGVGRNCIIMSRFFALFVFVAMLLVFGKETNTLEPWNNPHCGVNETWKIDYFAADCRVHCIPRPHVSCQCKSGYVSCKEIGGCVLPKDCPGTTQ